MLKVKIVLFSVILWTTMFFTTIVYAQTWILAYRHDAQGTSINGSIAQLAAAIRAGADVKVVFNPGGNDVSVPCNIAYAKGSGTQTYVACENTVAISAADTSDGAITFKDDAYHTYYILDTKGRVDLSSWYIGGGYKGHTIGHCGLKWFIRK